MAALERIMLQCRRLYICTRKLDRLTRAVDYRLQSTTVHQKLDPFVLFMMPQVQKLLRSLTGNDMDRVYETHRADIKMNPKYFVLNEEELKKEQEQIRRKAEGILSMPPYLDERKPRDTLLSSDHKIAEAITSKIVFVDISLNFKRLKGYNHRPMVVRHPNGELRNADWDTYDRMSQIFYPVADRKIVMPKMFEERQLEKILGKTRYRYILDRACVQFEPDSADFIRVTRRVFEHIVKHNRFEELRNTRFFGFMVFYLCQVSKMEGLILDMIERERIEDASTVIHLRQVMTSEPLSITTPLELVKEFVKKESARNYRPQLLEALKIYESKLQNPKLRSQNSIPSGPVFT